MTTERKVLLENKLRKIIHSELKQVKKLREVNDSKTIGRKFAQMCEWDGNVMAEAFMASLTDANHHTERKKLAPVLSKIFGIVLDPEG